MTYLEALDFLFHQLPVFQNTGGAAYKPGLERISYLLALCEHPEKSFKSIHIAGTNGKGSTSHMLASILHSAGYRVGLFTSPHLVDFRERIRVDQTMISQEFVTAFVQEMQEKLPKGFSPSFFEYTTAMAFSYFRSRQVDYAVIEAGMGGRLDSTNILSPIACVITNVSKDHTQYLGNTLEKIAQEKAGIIKKQTPIILGNSQTPEVLKVIENQARSLSSPLILADKSNEILSSYESRDYTLELETYTFGHLTQPLIGEFQIENTQTVLEVCKLLSNSGIPLRQQEVQRGLLLTHDWGLHGRFEIIRKNSPTLIIDTGHNPGAWVYLSERLSKKDPSNLIIILGMAKDKDVKGILRDLPHAPLYLMTQASSERSLPVEELTRLALEEGLRALPFPSISEALQHAKDLSLHEDFHTIFIGGSNFLIGDLLEIYSPSQLKSLDIAPLSDMRVKVRK